MMTSNCQPPTSTVLLRASPPMVKLYGGGAIGGSGELGGGPCGLGGLNGGDGGGGPAHTETRTCYRYHKHASCKQCLWHL